MNQQITRLEGYRDRRSELAEYGLTPSQLIEAVLLMHPDIAMTFTSVEAFEANVNAEFPQEATNG